MEIVDSRLLAEYSLENRLGKGAYGIVWKAKSKKNGQIVAVKKIFDAFSNVVDAQRTFREICYLQAVSEHPNIITLLNVLKATNNKDIYLIFDHMDTDLHRAIQGNILLDSHKRYITYQLAKALMYLHSGDVVHRDLKPMNILLNEACDATLCDFGLARSVRFFETELDDQAPPMTDYIATRWYRSPEILLGSRSYSKPSDMWSLGLIIAEMYAGQPLFPGKSLPDMINLIIQTLGFPTRRDIAGLDAPYAQALFDRSAAQWSDRDGLVTRLNQAPDDVVDLIRNLLSIDPRKRPTAKMVLQHRYLNVVRKRETEIELTEPVQIATEALGPRTAHSLEFYRTQLYEEIRRTAQQYQMEQNHNDEEVIDYRHSTPMSNTSQYSCKDVTSRDTSRSLTSSRAPTASKLRRESQPIALKPHEIKYKGRQLRKSASDAAILVAEKRDMESRQGVKQAQMRVESMSLSDPTSMQQVMLVKRSSTQQDKIRDHEDDGKSISVVQQNEAKERAKYLKKKSEEAEKKHLSRFQNGSESSRVYSTQKKESLPLQPMTHRSVLHQEETSRTSTEQRRRGSSQAHAMRNKSQVFGGLAYDPVLGQDGNITASTTKGKRSSSDWRKMPDGYGTTGFSDVRSNSAWAPSSRNFRRGSFTQPPTKSPWL